MGKDHLEQYLTKKNKPRFDFQLDTFEYGILRVKDKKYEIEINQKNIPVLTEI